MDEVKIRHMSDKELEQAFLDSVNEEVSKKLVAEMERRGEKGKTNVVPMEAKGETIAIPNKKGTHTRCPRCGYTDVIARFGSARSHFVGLILLCLGIIPGVLYYGFYGGKVVCPACRNRF